VITQNQIASVTGGFGLIGRRLISRLKDNGCQIKLLSLKEQSNLSGVEIVRGGINDRVAVKRLLSGADFLFHCAGELHDEARMNRVNVRGTELLFETAKGSNIKYFCHLSSAGVVGKTNKKWVDESADCCPQNAYERSKHQAEQIVTKGIDGCRVLILRPTNVIDNHHLGALKFLTEDTLRSRLKLFLIGGECSHIIHADNVAATAIHFINQPFESPEVFFVSADFEPMTTFSELHALYARLSPSCGLKQKSIPIHLPIVMPYIMRKILRGYGNRGDVRYSAQKLFSMGFKFPLSIEDTLSQILESDSLGPCEY
jgi:nucleoside-diphosphate-sugar epimerase